MMLKKEREVNFLMEKHLDDIKDWLKTSSEALRSFFSDDIEKIKFIILKKKEFQSTADNDRQNIWDKLCKGAYLPVIRGDLLGIAQKVGRVADAATDCCETFLFQRPEIPLKPKNQFALLSDAVFKLFPPIHDSILYYLRGSDVLKITRQNIKEFRRIKAGANTIESDLKHLIYASSLDAWHKGQLNSCIQSIVDISNQVDATVDEIQLIMMRLVS